MSRRGDYLLSHDMEDIIALLDGRPEIVDEVGGADTDLRAHLVARCSDLLDDDKFLAALPGHLLDESDSPGRLPLVTRRIAAIVETG